MAVERCPRDILDLRLVDGNHGVTTAIGAVAAVKNLSLAVNSMTNSAPLAGLTNLVFLDLVPLLLSWEGRGPGETPAVPPGSLNVSAFGLALVSVLWAYDGWEDVSFVGGEVRDPRRNLPRAIILGELGQGFRYAQVRLSPARLTHCMRWLGAARRAHDIAVGYARRRQAFGKAGSRWMNPRCD